jgi:molecular chaperone GrpE
MSTANNQDELELPEDSAAPAGDEAISAELQQAIAQAEENLNGWKRAQAEFENFRKRSEAETKDWMQFGKSQALAHLLPVMDSLSQALTYAPELPELTAEDAKKYASWKNGLFGISKQLESALADAGIQVIDAVGKQFDPHLHEAIKEIEGDSPPGTVVEQYQPGYQIDGKVIRPAQVGIAKSDLSKDLSPDLSNESNKQ